MDKIVNQICYPTIDKIGEEANDVAWFVIQYSIGKSKFMNKCAVILEKAVSENGELNPQPFNHIEKVY